jgi:hypothetical protein
VKLTDMTHHVHLTLDLGADGDEPVGSLGRAGAGRSRRFWGWLELIEAVEECIRQLRQVNPEQANPDETNPEAVNGEEGASPS